MSHVPTVLKSDRSVFDKMLPVDDNDRLTLTCCILVVTFDVYGQPLKTVWTKIKTDKMDLYKECGNDLGHPGSEFTDPGNSGGKSV